VIIIFTIGLQAFGSDALVPPKRTVVAKGSKSTRGNQRGNARRTLAVATAARTSSSSSSSSSSKEQSSKSLLQAKGAAVKQRKRRGDDDHHHHEDKDLSRSNPKATKDSFLSSLSRHHRRFGSVFALSSRRAFFQNAIAVTVGAVVGGGGVAAATSGAPPAPAAVATQPTTTSTTSAAVTGPSPIALPPVKSTDGITIIDPFLTRFLTVNDIPNEYFIDKKSIYGFVERIIDGDTFRVRHIPGFAVTRLVPEPLQQRGIANETLSIRIYAVDTPETGKNKRKTSQPFGQEASDFTTKLIYHKMVKITLLRRDQYGRAVAMVETVPDTASSRGVEITKDLSLELARNGLAELYTGGGAVYNNNRPAMEAAITYAQGKKLGIWSLGDNRVSAADYKKAQRDGNNGSNENGDDYEVEVAEPARKVGGVPVAASRANHKSSKTSAAAAAAAIASNKNKTKKNNDDHVLVAKSTNVPEKQRGGNGKVSAVAAHTLSAVLTGLEVFGV
jgi:endonuclease YncB( thermonuclease family)